VVVYKGCDNKLYHKIIMKLTISPNVVVVYKGIDHSHTTLWF